MRIKLTSVMVDDQEKALRFYTDVLGFRKKHEIPTVGWWHTEWRSLASRPGWGRSRSRSCRTRAET